MTNQNSEVATQIRPEQAMEQLGLKKDAYYEDLKFLGIKANRDSDGKSYLDPEQFELLVMLRDHVNETGKRDGFQVPGELVTTIGSEMGCQTEQVFSEPQTEAEQFDIESLVAAAAELAGSRMTMKEQVIAAIADHLTFDDLPDHVKARIENVRAAADPKLRPQQVALAVLNQWRQKQQANVA